MSFIQRIKAFIKEKKQKKNSRSIVITVHTSPVIQEDKKALDKVIEVLDPVSPAAEEVLPQYLAAAVHDPEVLDLRPSLGLPRFYEDEPRTPSSAYTGRTLFVTNADPAAYSFSTTATSIHSPVSSSNTFSSCSTYLPPSSFSLHLYDFSNIRGIGAGGFGSVHLVKHQPTGLKVALKVVDKRFCEHKAVHKEQKALLQIASQGNKGIVEFLGSFHNSRHYFFVTAYYGRGDLKAEIFRWGRLPIKLAKFYAAELLLAIQTVHNHGLVHRDIKPDNVFLTDDGHLVLGDFGLAASIVPPGEVFVPGVECKWFLQDMAGTLNYLSPEMWHAAPYNFSVDVWAYGIVVFEMLFGRTPWQGSLSDPLSVMDYRMEQATLDEWLGEEHPDKVTRLFLEGVLERDVFDRVTLGEAKSHCFFKGINWKKLAEGDLSVPHVGSPKNKISEDPDVFFGSFGGGGVYMGDEDPVPTFNYISPTLMTDDDYDPHDSDAAPASPPEIAIITTITTTTTVSTTPVAPITITPIPPSSSSALFEEIPLTDDSDDDSTTGLVSRTFRTRPPTPTASKLFSSIISSTPTAAPTIRTTRGSEATCAVGDEEQVASCGDPQIGRDGEDAEVAVQYKQPTVLARVRTFVGKALKALRKVCSRLRLHH